MSDVIHNQAGKKFVISSEFGDATLKYNLLDSQVIDYYSTFVPDEARGLGLAQKLVEAGVSYAKGNNYKIKTSCWYVDKYIEKNTELHSLRAKVQ